MASNVSGNSKTPWVKAEVPAKSEHRLRIVFRVPPEATPGRHVVPVDVKYGQWNLPQFDEAIVDVLGTSTICRGDSLTR